MSFGRFFLPGPTEVHPDVLAAQAHAVMGHRGKGMTSLIAAIDRPLRGVFRTERPVFISSSSATGFMEAGIRNAVRRRALALVNGAFSQRFADLVTDCGRELDTYAVEWGQHHQPEEVERRLREGGFDAVTVVHSETSTGVLNPLAEIAEAVRAAESATGEEILLLVDAVTSIAGAPVETDAWGLDWVLTGSQKALALPPGLAFGSASSRLLARAAELPARGQYFDLVEFARNWEKQQTPNTPALTLIFALREQLSRIEAEGFDARLDRHRAMARRCWEWTETVGVRFGLSLFAPEGYRAPTVTAIAVPDTHRGSDITKALEARGYTIGSGYGKLKDATIRIGHMGDHDLNGLNQLLAELEEILEG
jgi:aspartate aminotransferase-like enzyme